MSRPLISIPRIFVAVALCGLLGCSATTSNGRARSERGRVLPPSKLTPDAGEIPVEIRAIERQIEANSVILAEEIDIHVSKNYQFEVSLVGDNVSKDLDKSSVHDRISSGRSTVFFRNMQLRGDRKIRVRIAGTGTRPFIKIRAKGHCSHIVVGSGDTAREVHRADGITIDGSSVRYINEERGAASRN